MKARITVLGALALVFILVGVVGIPGIAHAMGGAKPTGGLPGGSDPALEKLVSTLALNPYIQTLQNEFRNSKKPIHTPSGDLATVDDSALLIGVRYDCRMFNALSKTDALTRAESRTWYQFSHFGSLFIDNVAFVETGGIRTFAPHPGLENEVWGQSDDKNYYEALRVMDNGDLIIESFAAKDMWAKSALSFLGINVITDQLIAKLEGFAITSIVGGQNGFITSYSYCPRPLAK